tara:strand:- start:8060 stop:8170 length:111 start_codon:yes stop_codon:yes gene_type:complete
MKKTTEKAVDVDGAAVTVSDFLTDLFKVMLPCWHLN